MAHKSDEMTSPLLQRTAAVCSKERWRLSDLPSERRWSGVSARPANQPPPPFNANATFDARNASFSSRPAGKNPPNVIYLAHARRHKAPGREENSDMTTCGPLFFLLRLLSFLVFSVSFISFPSPLPPFLCRLEFISNQRASRELQLLITFSFAFLHINDCRVFGRVFAAVV